MKSIAALFLVVSLATAIQLGAQLPERQKLNTNDIQVVPFTREHLTTKFKPNDREMPDELRATTTGQIRITGKKKTQPCQLVRGKLACHNGKLVLIPPGERSGKLTVKKPTSDDALYHFASVELPDSVLDTKEIKLEAGVEYTWAVKGSGDAVTFSVRSMTLELATFTVPKEKFLGFGIAATVRNKGNEADLTLTFD